VANVVLVEVECVFFLCLCVCRCVLSELHSWMGDSDGLGGSDGSEGY